MIKKIILIISLILTLNATQTITVAGPGAGVTHPIFKMIQDNALQDLDVKIKFKSWKNPDELKALILNQKVNFIATPITAASILYNRGAKVQLTHLVMGGARGVVSFDTSIQTIKDLKGKRIGISSRGGLGDSLIKILLKENGIDYKKDVKIVYTQSSKNSTMMLFKKKIDVAMLSEPRISMALKKMKSLPSDKGVYKLFFNLNLVDVWKKTFKTKTSFAQVGFLAVGDTIKDKKLIQRFIEEYKKAQNWYINNPKDSSKLTVKYLKGLHPKAVENGIKNSNFYILETSKDKKLIKTLLNRLVLNNPKSMGNKLPNDGFYF